jgi:hypothetical protein
VVAEVSSWAHSSKKITPAAVVQERGLRRLGLFLPYISAGIIQRFPLGIVI